MSSNALTSGMVTVALCIAGLLGLAVGSFLNAVIARVPWSVPCARRGGIRGRTGRRWPHVELATACAFAAATWRFLDAPAAPVIPVVAAYLFLATISIALTLIDLDTHRLPNRIVLPAYIVLFALFGVAVLLGADARDLAHAAIGGAAMFVFYFALRMVRPAGMGGGDVKLAGVLGIALAWLGWGEVIVGALSAFVLGGIFGIVLLASRRADRKSAIPFGPWMLAGAWVGIFAGDAVALWYIGLASP